MEKAVFYHAGCPVCVNAEQDILKIIDRSKYDPEVVHLGQDPTRIPEAEVVGVESVPALWLNQNVLHINFGASLTDVKNG
ncbi:thioredoxin family protein [Fulvivirga sp. 29W222]|uniref:Thioredoxin family protein n=1 Tax=Fulvivirga marina TaxID=2494733 RepID=A0A937FYB4_9BACT|nr:thioredoxin family protein [Fulvivirga marina]MBL6445166.1 thioredoxin family protein [Fulvivirga marina]